MKKYLFIAIYFLFIIIFLCGCDPWSGKRPYDYGKAIWTSDSPKGWFIVNTYEEDKNFIFPKGVFIVDNKNIKFILGFDYSNVADFVDENGVQILFGTCKYYPGRLVIKIDKTKDRIFNGMIEKITFIREPISSTQ
jgi:hypothetical protein